MALAFCWRDVVNFSLLALKAALCCRLFNSAQEYHLHDKVMASDNDVVLDDYYT